MTAGPVIERVLQVHTRYRQPGGEDRVVEAERQLLEAAGISVRQVIFDNADIRESESLGGDLRLAASTIWSPAAKRRVRAALRDHRPDVMHVHNTFPSASPSVYFAASEQGVPVVQTLHNYRLVCPAGTAFRDGRACTDCVGRAFPWPAILHGSYRGSRPQSAVASTMLAVHRALGTFAHRIDAYVALTEFQRQLMVTGGLPSEKIHVIPNFLEPDPGTVAQGRDSLLFVGRLAEEKGVRVLLDAARQRPALICIAGAGPLSSEVEAAAAGGEVRYLGELDRPSVLDEMRRASAVLIPSVWFEGFPVVVLEAFATGTPLIASRIGSLPEIVENGVTGLLVESGDQALAEGLRWAQQHPDEMRRMGGNARMRYETAFRGEGHLAALTSLYRSVVARRIMARV